MQSWVGVIGAARSDHRTHLTGTHLTSAGIRRLCRARLQLLLEYLKGQDEGQTIPSRGTAPTD